MNYLSIATVVLAGIAAGLSQLPYPWARLAAVAITSAVGGMHIPNVTGAVVPKGKEEK